jgi:hypothetical protein
MACPQYASLPVTSNAVYSSRILSTVMMEALSSSEMSALTRVAGLNIPEDGIFLRSVRRLLVAACVVPSSPIFVTLMKEAPGSSETPFFRTK